MAKYGYLVCRAEHGRVTDIIPLSQRMNCSIEHKKAGCPYLLHWVPAPLHKRVAAKVLGEDFK